MQLRLERPDQPDVAALVEELDAFQAPLYPAESNHLLDIAALTRPNVAFAVARDPAGSAQACGALVFETDHAELKRMYVRPALRGRGLAKMLCAALEAEALRRGCTCLRLETGIRQPEAIALYERLGFKRRPPFGGYAEDPLSVFMEKMLNPTAVTP